MIINLLKMALMAVSFSGLCMLVMSRMKLSGTAAPLVAASGVILLMMLGGMAHVLRETWWALFVAGLVLFVWEMLRRHRLQWLPLALLGAALVYGCWRYRHAFITSGDTISHWAMAAKYMLNSHRLPDSSTQLIYFQTYPLGTTAFIYYAAFLFGPSESVYILSQLMFNVMAFLPVFGLIRRRRICGMLLAGSVLAFLLWFNVAVTSLQVDSVLSFMAIGGVAVIAENWDDPRRGLTAVLPMISALMFIKHSGAIFCLIITGVMLACIRENRENAGRRAGLKCLVQSAVAMAVPFALWEIHVKLAYPTAGTSKHAVSLNHYSEVASGKSFDLVRQVAADMLRRLVHPSKTYAMLLLMGLVALALCALVIGRRGTDRALWARRLKAAVIACVAAYVVWYMLLLLMYVFSMTVEEAKTLASISRYEKSMIACIIGGVTVFVLTLMCGGDPAGDSALSRFAMPALAAGMALMALIGGGGLRSSPVYGLLRTPSSMPEDFKPILAMEQRYGIEPQKSYMIFTRHDEYELHTALYTAKYEFYTNDFVLICGGIHRTDYDYEGYYRFRNVYAHQADIDRIDDLQAVLAEHMDEVDYLLVCVRDPVFEQALDGFMQTWQGKTRVLYAYER